MMFRFETVQTLEVSNALYWPVNVCDPALRPVIKKVAPDLTGSDRSDPEIDVASEAVVLPVPPVDENDMKHGSSSVLASSVALIITRAFPLAVIVAATEGPVLVAVSP